MSEWRAGSFRMTGSRPLRIAGWLYGHFGIDRRREDGWHVNHIPTGFSAGCIIGTFDQARAFVEAIERDGDWNFTDTTPPLALKMVVHDAVAALGFTRETGTGSPQGMPA